MGTLNVIPRGARPHDEELSHAVFAAVRSRCTRAGLHDLSVGIQGGVVTLQGLAGSFYDKQLMLHAAQHVPGVVGLIDNIDVVTPVDVYAD